MIKYRHFVLLGTCISIFFFIFPVVFSQNQTGIVFDQQHKPIEFATILLIDENNKTLEVQTTDSTGYFKLNRSPTMNQNQWKLVAQHLLYYTDTIGVIPDINHPYTILLTKKEYFLNEVAVIGEQPKVRVDGNNIIYNANHIVKNKIVSSVSDLLKEIPAVIKTNDGFSLAGGDELTIILNGQRTSMTIEQVKNMLDGISASKVKSIEVMYSPPAKYNVKGALINIILDSDVSRESPLVGDMRIIYNQSFYASSKQLFNMTYTKKKFRIDLMSQLYSGNNWGKTISLAEHNLKNNFVLINEDTRKKSNFLNFNTRLGGEYTMKTDSKIIFSIYYETNKDNSNNWGDNIYKMSNQLDSISSLNYVRDRNQLFDTYIEYKNKKFSVGGEYKKYNNPTNSHYNEFLGNLPVNYSLNKSRQDINSYSLFANHETKLSALNLTYGINTGYTRSHTKVNFFTGTSLQTIEDKDKYINGLQNEYSLTPFIDLYYVFSKKMSLSASMKFEYFKSDYDNNGNQTNLWDDFTLYPNLTLTYNPDARNMFQLGFTQTKRFPSFWAINPQVTFLNSYTRIEGNPELKPSNIYKGQLVYILNRKYTFVLFSQYVPKYFTQLPHMSNDEAEIIYRYENFDYLIRSGITFVAPVKIGEQFTTQITLQGMRSHEKDDDFYNSSFNNISFSGIAVLDNTLKVTSNLLFQLTAFYQTKSRQGVYRLGDICDLSANTKWTFLKNGSLTLSYDNIVRHQRPKPMIIDYSNQYRWSKDIEKNTFSITLNWKFGSYKTKSYNKIDSSRLGK